MQSSEKLTKKHFFRYFQRFGFRYDLCFSNSKSISRQNRKDIGIFKTPSMLTEP